MTHRISLLSLALSALTLGACAVETGSTDTESTSAAVSAASKACGASIGKSCAAGLSCEGLPLPSSGLIGGSGVCESETPCDPNAASSCATGLVCVACDLKHYGKCEAFLAGETVGAGYACGGSIGTSCVSGLHCNGLPLSSSHLTGGSGVCSAAPSCNPNTNLACGKTLDCVAVDTKHSGSCLAPGHGQSVGKGYICGPSIGEGCAAGLTCEGLPTSGMLGGTGTCD